MLNTSIQVKTDHFDGPLALLLLLIEKEEMNIRELDLTKITKQYLEYLSQMKDLNFDIAGDYLYLASTLLLLKSKICITEEEVKNLELNFGIEGMHITSQAELIRRLEELQLYQKMSKILWNVDKKGHEVFVKPRVDRKAIINSILTPMDLNSLTLAMIDFLFKQKRKYTVVKRDRLSIKEKLKFLKSNLKVGEQITFETLLELDGQPEPLSDGEVKNPTDNIVITFISLLELARLKRINVFQNQDRSTIYVNVVRSLEDFDIDQANGFEDENTEVAVKNMIASDHSEEKLVVEDLGEYTEDDYLEKYGELLTTPDSVDSGAKLIQ